MHPSYPLQQFHPLLHPVIFCYQTLPSSLSALVGLLLFEPSSNEYSKNNQTKIFKQATENQITLIVIQ